MLLNELGGNWAIYKGYKEYGTEGYTSSYYKMSLQDYRDLGRPNKVQLTVTATPAP